MRLDDRDEVYAKASAADLVVPRALEAAFEGDRGFAAASAEAEAELAAIRAYAQAMAVREEDPGIVEQVGLWGLEPEADIARRGGILARASCATPSRPARRRSAPGTVPARSAGTGS